VTDALRWDLFCLLWPELGRFACNARNRDVIAWGHYLDAARKRWAQ